MNAGQIIMSMMQEVSTTVPGAAVTAVGQQMPGEGGFADLLVTLQTEAQQFQKVPEPGSEPPESEPEPATLQSERITDVNQGSLEVSNAGAQMILAAYAQPARMPSVNDQPDHDVDMLQNVAETRQTVQPSVTLAAVAAKMELEPFAEPLQSSPFNALEETLTGLTTPQQQSGRMPIVNTPPSHDVDTVQNVQGSKAGTADRHQSTPSQQNGRMPVVNNQPSHDVGATQNAQPAPPVQVFEPVQSALKPIAEPQLSAVSERPAVRQSMPIEMSPKTVEAAVQRQPSTPPPPQLDGRFTVVNTPPRPDVDVVENVAAAAPTQSLEEISFSLARPISVSRNHSSELNRNQHTAIVDRPHIISLDLNQIQSQPTDIQSTSELPEVITSVRGKDADRTASATNAINPEPLSAQKRQSVAAMPVLPTETVLVKPETDVLEKETADIRAASLQRPLHGAPDQIVVGTRLETEKQNAMPSLTKEDLLLQQNAKPVGETSLTSDDSMGGSADQTGSDQNSDSRMMTPLVHNQSKPEHQNVASVSSNKINPELSGQDLPDRVAHQVRERLNQQEAKQGSQQITLTLSPENLGEVKMSLNLQGQRLSVEILTENRTVRDAILQHSDSLKDSLARQNITVDSFDVTTNGRGNSNPGHNQDAWKELARQKQQQQFWTSTGGYHPPQMENQSSPLAYQAKNEQAMLDIHY